MTVAVVIPYFQRQPGVLLRSLRSITSQTVVPDLIVVVDDESPAPVDAELHGLPDSWRARVKVVRQPNGGPGAARNAGIGAVPSGTTYVALLDSDDEWSPDHIANAVTALDAGHDVYFSNYVDIDDAVDGFTRRGAGSLDRHPHVGGVEHLRHFADDMLSQILSANVMQLSTTVFRMAAAPDVRFRTEYRRAGEDMLFFLDLARRTDRYCYSTRVEVTYGRGVNVYRSAVMGDPAAFDRIRDETRFRRAVLADYSLNATQRASARRALSRVRKHFAAEVLHQLRRRQAGVARSCRRQFSEDAASALLLGPNAVACLADWLHLRPAKSERV